MVRPDGSIRWIRSRAFPMQRSKTGTSRASPDWRKTSASRKQAEGAIRESEQRFRTFVDHATDAFFLQDERLVILDVNRQACRKPGVHDETSCWG